MRFLWQSRGMPRTRALSVCLGCVWALCHTSGSLPLCQLLPAQCSTHPLPVPGTAAGTGPELWLCAVGWTSWACARGRATLPDRLDSFLGSSFKRTWSHDRICTKLVCNQDLYVKMERDLCGLLYPDTNNLHPFIAGNLTWTSVPAHDATYGPCMSVAWPQLIRDEGNSETALTLAGFRNWNIAPQWQ